jgi:hypothetical protein
MRPINRKTNISYELAIILVIFKILKAFVTLGGQGYLPLYRSHLWGATTEKK